jgi:NAD(P)-dependent dehydrogenase (short-subunit alcohol dehydrogenase family)
MSPSPASRAGSPTPPTLTLTRMAGELSQQYGGIDVVLSNATSRLTPEAPQEEQADEFIDVARRYARNAALVRPA